MINFNSIIVYIGTLVILVSFISAFRLRKEKKSPVYFSFFYWIPFVALLVSINTIIAFNFTVFSALTFNSLQHLIFLLEFSVTCLFFHKVFNNKNKFVVILFFVAVFSFGALLWINGLSKVLFQLYALPCLAIFTLSMYYYYQLFTDDKPILNLLKAATFWIVTGLFFFSAITLPLFAIQEYLKYKFGYTIGSYILSFTNIFIIIKHLFFIKAYKCAKLKSIE